MSNYFFQRFRQFKTLKQLILFNQLRFFFSNLILSFTSHFEISVIIWNVCVCVKDTRIFSFSHFYLKIAVILLFIRQTLSLLLNKQIIYGAEL